MLPLHHRPVWALQNVCNYDRPKPTSRLDMKQSPVLSTPRCASRLLTAGAFRAVTSWVETMGIEPSTLIVRRSVAPLEHVPPKTVNRQSLCYQDSNLNEVGQNHSCCHYIITQLWR